MFKVVARDNNGNQYEVGHGSWYACNYFAYFNDHNYRGLRVVPCAQPLKKKSDSLVSWLTSNMSRRILKA